MDQCKDPEEGVPPSTTSLCGEDEALRMKKQRPHSPGPSCESIKSDRSMFLPVDFKDGQSADEWMKKQTPDSPGPSCVSMKSDRSMFLPIDFKVGESAADGRMKKQTPDSPGPSCVSMKSDRSMFLPIDFKVGESAADGRMKKQTPDSPGPSCVSMKSDRSMFLPIDFKVGESAADGRVQQETSEIHSDLSNPQHQENLDSVLLLLEENIVTFVRSELKRVRGTLCPEYSEWLGSQCEDDGILDGEDEQQRTGCKEAFLKISLLFLRKMKQEKLADQLQSRTLAPVCQKNLKSTLKEKFQCVFEGIAKAGNPTLLNQIYTELYITEGGTGEVNEEHDSKWVEMTFWKADRAETTIRQEDIFKGPPGRDEPIRTVMTKSVAGIGKTVLTQKFTLDWAEGKANQDIQFIFPFSFRELNVLKEKKLSLVELVHSFFTEAKEAGLRRFEEFQVVFIFDGLDECRLPLNFHNSEILTDVNQSTSVDVLLTNLIRGTLLPSARLWITTRPAAASQIPPGCVDMVTEVRGFTDPQKEEYLRKKLRDEEQASKIISHIKASQSLHIICRIPVFCWITATVLEDLLKTREGGELPKTLTEMYIHFLVVQTKLKSIKYDGGSEIDSQWSPESREMIKSLGKLAFEQLQKGNLIFYEADLTECGIDIRAASVYSGVFTQVFREERGLYKDQVFCFIHLSVQEFLAALHVHQTFFNSGINLMEEEKTTSHVSKDFENKTKHFYQSGVDQALKSPNGHLDLFLRFLLGLSIDTNHNHLLYFLKQKASAPPPKKKATEYIKKKINEDLSAEKSINLFHCLNELNDGSLVEEIQQSLRSGHLSTDKLSPAHWSALVFILLSSEEDLDVFDLKKYSASEEALLRLLPVVKASNKALLSGCLISEEGCAYLASALSSSSHLRELDLSYNHPGERGESLLSSRLEDPYCRLETLRFDHGGLHILKPGLGKYAYELEVDTNTTGRELILSDNNKMVTHVKEVQPYPDHPDRFDVPQLLCQTGLTGRCYWEVKWRGRVIISASYRGIIRKGYSDECLFAFNDQSWGLHCSDEGYSVRHNSRRTDISSSVSGRVAVYVDCPAGTLSFYRVSSDRLIHLHTFNTTFTEPLYPGFRLCSYSSSVSLCNMLF
ncbi:protein NLRC3-like isoform X2 [Cheilinus undulatus]|uniref:protein NLRC3-like isoform X2 n=1 Tax=Cheilinus undulatus TaxID=241271 RepID=UPI001BD42CB6|nr:protein NLRC3-like isoform X2 [Cheilinus undulatus]